MFKKLKEKLKGKPKAKAEPEVKKAPLPYISTWGQSPVVATITDVQARINSLEVTSGPRTFMIDTPQSHAAFTNAPTFDAADFEAVTQSDGSVSLNRVKDNDTREEKKPVEVFEQLLRPMPQFRCDEAGIKADIAMVERRIEVLGQHIHSSFADEREALAFLAARLKFMEHKDKFSWPTTTPELIEALLKKYKLQEVSVGAYYKTMPSEAVEEMDKFTKAFKHVCPDKEPQFKLIVDKTGPERRRDPVLLALSPFGRWYFVCGAWDKEVEVLGELIYGNSGETLK